MFQNILQILILFLIYKISRYHVVFETKSLCISPFWGIHAYRQIRVTSQPTRKLPYFKKNQLCALLTYACT